MSFRAVILLLPPVQRPSVVEAALLGLNACCKIAHNLEEIEKAWSGDRIDLLFYRLSRDGWNESTKAVLQRLREQNRERPILLLTEAELNCEDLLSMFRNGASDVLPVQLAADELRVSVRRFGVLREATDRCSDVAFPFGSSRSMQLLQAEAQRAAASNSTVLITGDTGTGKEVTARFIHEHSERSQHALVPINCSAIPESLIESELFGHERGAFTGAVRTQVGAFELAHNSTVFLDEVGELSPLAQVKLLRVLETRAIRPVGGQFERPVNIRIIAATNQELERLVEEKKFRKDLYFRLNILRLHLPPLRDRMGDLPSLVRFHLLVLCRQMSRPPVHLATDLMARLTAYHWPGNIRELRNILECLLVHSPGQVIDLAHTPDHVRSRLASAPIDKHWEKLKILQALDSSLWNKSEAAKILHCSRMTLYRKLVRYQIEDK